MYCELSLRQNGPNAQKTRFSSAISLWKMTEILDCRKFSHNVSVSRSRLGFEKKVMIPSLVPRIQYIYLNM
jgi:hypothetical protein